MRPGRAAVGRWAAWTAALGLPLALTWAGQHYDICHYYGWAHQVAAGQLPYRDFVVEYPPLALAFVLAPRALAASLSGFAAAFKVQVGVCAAVQKVVLARHVRAPWALLAALSAAEACLYATYLKRFDVFAAACTSLALVAVVRAPRRRLGWLLLGLGAAIKLYPALLVPLACRYAAPRVGRRRAWLTGPAWALGAFCLPLAAAWSVCGTRATSWFGYHAARGLHLPSSYTAVWLSLGNFGTPLPYGMHFGAMQVLTSWADAWARHASGVLLLGLAATYAAVLPRVRDATSLWRAATASVAALLLLAKVLSPQFVAWLLPLATVAAVGVGVPPRWNAPTCTTPSPATRGPRQAARGAKQTVDVVLLGLVLAVAALTAELFPHEQQLAEPYVHRRGVLVARTLALAAVWGWAAFGPDLDRGRGGGDAPGEASVRPGSGPPSPWRHHRGGLL